MSGPATASVRGLAEAAKCVTRTLRTASTAQKNAALLGAAARIVGPMRTAILGANAEDVADAARDGLSAAMVDRLRLDDSRLEGVARAVREIAALPDPVGGVVERRTLANGLRIERVRVPLGVVAMLYESRPNVTSDAAALCLKSGNAVVLRGGKEALRTNRAIAMAYREAIAEAGLPAACVALIETTDRAALKELLGFDDLIDVVVPRGGDALIGFVREHARMPVIRHHKGVCHAYVHGDADLEMATRIVVNAKTQRPGVCNALETLLVDRAIAADFLPQVAAELAARGVELRGDSETRALVPAAVAATEEDWDAEYLALKLAVRVVGGFDEALEHIERHGTRHTEAIVTRDDALARRFVSEVDASLVLVNASTRFNDGGELGLGAELGIATTKLHAYGPMGLPELCALKWIGYGAGQVREG